MGNHHNTFTIHILQQRLTRRKTMESEPIDLIEVIKAQRGNYTNKALQNLNKEIQKQGVKP